MRLAADANVLLAAVLGGRARLILESAHIEEIVTVERVTAEVQEYAMQLAREKNRAEGLVLLAVGALPVSIAPRMEYKASIAEAEKANRPTRPRRCRTAGPGPRPRRPGLVQ